MSCERNPAQLTFGASNEIATFHWGGIVKNALGEQVTEKQFRVIGHSTTWIKVTQLEGGPAIMLRFATDGSSFWWIPVDNIDQRSGPYVGCAALTG